jgi:predicted GNAT family N-acyltransferase
VNPVITIVAAAWSEDQERLRRIRHAVFVVEQKVDAREEWDGADAECHHALALTAEGEVIGTARMQPSGKIGRVAVLQPWRGRGIGRQLMEYLLQVATRQGMSRVYLNSQESAVAFYERLGFVCVGEPFVEANIPHRRMELVVFP